MRNTFFTIIACTFICFLLAGQAMAFSLYEATAMSNDVNKYWYDIPDGIDPNDLSDSRMCWAATAANILKLTNWGLASDVDDGYDLEYTIYHEFMDAFANNENYVQTAFDSYLNWHYSAMFNDTVSQFTGISTRNYYRTGSKVADLKGLIDEMYDGDTEFYGISLSIKYDEYCHAITAWGYEPVSDTELTLYYTDSDDGIDGIVSTRMYLDSLDKWRIEYGRRSWMFRYYAAFSALPGSQIIHDDVVLTPVLQQEQNLIALGLDFAEVIPMDPINPKPVEDFNNRFKGSDLPMPGPMPDPVPEPATILLLGLGLIGLAAKRKGLG